MESQKNVGQAIASMVLGILSLILFGIFTAIPAVICGHIAKSKIKANPALQGGGLATAGLVMGYLVIGFSILILPMMAAIAIPSFQKARSSAMEMACENNCRIIDAAKAECAMEHGLPDGSPVLESSLAPYIKGDFSQLNCPAGGAIEINPIGVDPECSIHSGME